MKPLPRLIISSALLLVVLTQCAPQACVVARPITPQKISLSTRAQVRWLDQVVTKEHAAEAAMWPEGELFLWEFHALGLQNVALTTQDEADAKRANEAARIALQQMDALLDHKPFSKMKHWEVRGGICWFAGQNLVRALMLILNPDADPAEFERYHRDTALLARAFEKSESGVLEAHPGMSWPVDSLFALYSLKLHDNRYSTHYFAPAYAKWKRTVTAGADKTTGLMPSFTFANGAPRDVPRGCALSWSLAVLPELDPEFARDQWNAYKKHFSSCALGVCLFREYPRGSNRKMDADSGPIAFGFGMSATAFALAAARANGDVEMAASLQRLGDTLGLPLWTWSGRRYLFGAAPLFDVFSVWVSTVYMGPTASPSGFSILPLALIAFVLISTALLLRSIKQSVLALRAEARGAPRPASPPGSAPGATPPPDARSPSAAPPA